MTREHEHFVTVRSVRTTLIGLAVTVGLGFVGVVLLTPPAALTPGIGLLTFAVVLVEASRSSVIRISSTRLQVGRVFRRPLLIGRSDIRAAFLVDERRVTTGCILVVETNKLRRLPQVYASGGGRSELAKIAKILATGAPVNLTSRWWV